jgi:hypothetical protein
MNPDSAFMMVPEESGFKEVFIPKDFQSITKFLKIVYWMGMDR